jgi:hypothetical protein
VTFFDENKKISLSTKNLLTFSLDLDPEYDPDPHLSKSLDCRTFPYDANRTITNDFSEVKKV